MPAHRYLAHSRQLNHLHIVGGHGLRRDIQMDEVKQHNKPDDAWMVLQGKVYNITPYLKFHPGGADILVKAAGKDGTSLFQKYHPWVNGHALLEKCLLGLLYQPSMLERIGVSRPAGSGSRSSSRSSSPGQQAAAGDNESCSSDGTGASGAVAQVEVVQAFDQHWGGGAAEKQQTQH